MSDQLSVIVVDDEFKSRQVLIKLLQDHFQFLTIIGEASTARQARALINLEQPDILFLDIEMPEESGFDLLRSLPMLDFEVIFVTGFDQFAIQAIKICAIGYVLKPVDIEDLTEAIHNAHAKIRDRNQLLRNHHLVKNLEANSSLKIGIPSNDVIEFVSLDEIIRCEGQQKYTMIYCNESQILSSYNIGEFKRLLTEKNFYSPHKSHLINLNFLKKYSKDGTIELTDGSFVPVSKRKRQEFQNVIRRL